MQCEKHEQTTNKINILENSLSKFEVFVQSIDRELNDIKNSLQRAGDKINQLSNRLQNVEIKLAEMPLRVFLLAVTIGAGVSSIITAIILILSKFYFGGWYAKR